MTGFRLLSRTGEINERNRNEVHSGPTQEEPLQNIDELQQENAALRDRIAKLSAATLRISAGLDLDTVLNEIIESARALVDARYGVITTTNATGEVEDIVMSGFTPEECQQMLDWPDGPRLFEYFRETPGIVRYTDLPAYAGSLGLLHEAKTFQGTPMHHQGRYVGSFILAGKRNGTEFTNDDEDILVLFASQAGTVIVNAHAHRDEQRARADLEAVIDTSPVGVVVFDANTGMPVSLNQEVHRIVGSLRSEDGTSEQLLEVARFQRADGQEISLAEFPLASLLSNAEVVHAEEMVLSVPDGRSIKILVSVTPIRSSDGAVESVVAVIQDLAPLEELERLRTEFLSMVSHELRSPLIAIKGSAATVLGTSHPLDQAEIRQIFRIIDEQADHMRGLISDLLDAGRIDTGTLSITPEPTEVAVLVDQARNTFLSGGGQHTIYIDLPPELPRVMADRHRIVQVLNNLLSNAALHSPQSSPIRVAAVRDGVHMAISVSDDGRGIPAEQLPYLFRKHSRMVDDEGMGGLRGSGLGLAICKGLVEAHGGRIVATSGGEGHGACFTFTIPVAVEAGSSAAPGADQSRSGWQPTQRARPRILVVDDDPQTLRYVRDTLTDAGYAPLMTGDPEKLSYLIQTEQPQLVLLDLILPGADGIELMERVPELADQPVIFISAYGRDETIAKALRMGADDYIVKPFSPTELTARVEAALRRRSGPEPFVLDELSINYEQRRVTVAGRAVQLTATEYELLRLLAINAGRVSTHDMLLCRVWGQRGVGEMERVRTIVKKIRRKLGDDAARPRYIFTERGVGYRMASPDND